MPHQTSEPATTGIAATRGAATGIEGWPAVITGAASGIGRSLAEQLGRRGSPLLLADIDSRNLARVAGALQALAMPTDVADPAAVERLADAAPGVRLVCLNAGVLSTRPGPIWEAPPNEWDRVFAVNLGGVVNGLRAFVPRLLDTGQPASILITASLAGLATWPGGGPYAASKHAVVTVAEQAALALAGTAVSITVLCPALVRSGMSATGEDPDHVAHAALRAVEERRFSVVPPEWHHAIRQRADRLASGAGPEIPRLDVGNE
jgi:NAD(P)-dependent dehydrogenase (short-subunit alcohol dehydrogenase family)